MSAGPSGSGSIDYNLAFLQAGGTMKAKAKFFGITVFLIASAIFSLTSQQVAAQTVTEPRDKSGSVLTVEGKHIVVAQKESQLIILLDLYPNRQELDVAGKSAKDIVMATAKYYAKQSLLKSNYQSANSAIVYIVYVENMDEYNRADYAGMKRFGTLTYTKAGGDVTLSEDKLSKIP